MEHVNLYNQSMEIYSKNKALMCKTFPSNLGPMTMRWYDELEKGSIQSYNELIRAFKAWFMTCSRTPKSFNSLLTMSKREGETLRTYSNCYWELYNEIGGDNGGIAGSTFKVRFPIDSKLRALLALKPIMDMHKLMEGAEEYIRLENDQL